jgi:transposase
MHQAASRSGCWWVVVELFYHILPAESTPSAAFTGALSPTSFTLEPREGKGSQNANSYTMNEARQRELEAIEKQLFHLHAQRFDTPEAAQAALATLAQSWRSHQIDTSRVLAHKRYAGKGRPTPHSPITSIAWQMQAQVRVDQERLPAHKQHSACFVIGTNSAASQLSEAEGIAAYTSPSGVEGGFRFLKDPVFFLFVKKPSRIQGLLRVMT